MAGIVNSLIKHHRSMYHLYTDCLYSSVALARDPVAQLQDLFYGSIVKSTSKHLPKDLIKSQDNALMKEMPKTPRGTFYVRQNGPLVVAVWRDSKVMMTISTGHQGWRDPTVHIAQRKIPNEAGRLRVTSIPAPPQVLDYIRHMGGVDRNDQLRSYFTCSRKAQFWWKKIMYFLLDIARVNSWISYKQHHMKEGGDMDEDDDDDVVSSTSKMSHSSFVVTLATELIAGYTTSKENFRQSRATSCTTIKGHYCSKMPGMYPKRCRWCRLHRGVTPKGRTKTTRSGCPVCGVHLCPGRCFALFHAAFEQLTSTSTSE